MKKILPLLVMTAFFISVICKTNAQTTISYTYDATGNRTERNVITLKSAKPDLGDTTNTKKKKEFFEENIGKQKVLIYPNPTRGELKIEIQGYQQDIKATVYLYTLSGKLLQTQNPAGNTFTLDLSAYAIGTYILKIGLGNKLSEWKIIKE